MGNKGYSKNALHFTLLAWRFYLNLRVTFAACNNRCIPIMYSKYWLVIKDDSKRTFEVCGQAANENSFANKTYAMQKAGMNVSGMTPPVTNKNVSKETIKIFGYSYEVGLQNRLSGQYLEITMRSEDHW